MSIQQQTVLASTNLQAIAPNVSDDSAITGITINRLVSPVKGVAQMMGQVLHYPEGKPLRVVDQLPTLSLLMSNNVITQVQRSLLGNSYCDDVIMLLLNTPFLKQKLECSESLTADEWEKLITLADDLQVKIDMGNRHLESLQLIANAGIGKQINFLDLAQVHDILGNVIGTLQNPQALATADQVQQLVDVDKEIDKQLSISIFDESDRRAVVGLLTEQRDALIDTLSQRADTLAPGLARLKTMLHTLRFTEAKDAALLELSDELDALLSTLPDCKSRETIMMLHNNLRAAGLSILRERFKESLKQQLAHLDKNGSSYVCQMTLSIGAAASLLGISAAKSTADVLVKLFVEAANDNQIREGAECDIGLNLSVGNKNVATAKAKANLSYGHGKAFKGIDDFVEYHADSLLTSLLTKNTKNIDGKDSAIDAEKTQRQAVAQSRLLREALCASGAISVGDTFKTPTKKHVDYSTMRIHSKHAKLSLVSRFLEGSYQFANRVMTFYKHSNLLRSFQTNPKRVDSQPAKYFSVNYQGKLFNGKKGFDKLSKGIPSALEVFRENHKKSTHYWISKSAEQRKAVRDDLKHAMVALFCEYDHYCDVVNKYDHAKKNNTAHWRDMRDIKHSMERDRGANGRGEFIRALITTHAKLEQLYKQTFIDSESHDVKDAAFSRLLASMGASYEKPQLYLKDSAHIKKHLTTVSRAGLDIDVHQLTAKLHIPGSGRSTSAACTLKNIKVRVDKNSDNDVYLRRVQVTTQAACKLNDLLTSIETTFIKKADDALPPVQFNEVPAKYANIMLGNAMSVEADFIKSDEGYALRYVRVVDKNDYGLNSPNMNIPVGIVGSLVTKGKFKISNTENIYEYLGENTFSYIQSKYNSWKLAGRTNDKWQHYLAENKRHIANVIVNMRNRHSNAHAEFMSMLNSLEEAMNGEQYAELCQPILDAFEVYSRDKHNNKKYIEAEIMLTKLFEAYYPIFLKEDNARYVDV